MNAASIISLVSGTVGLINTVVLPLIQKSGGSAKTTDTISGVIDIVGAAIPALKEFGPLVPLAKDQIMSTYTGIKNIIRSVGPNPATTEEQLASLKAFDKEVDDAWDAIEAQLDPDAQPPVA